MGKNKLLQNYNALKSLPLVKQLIIENQNLKLEKKALLLLLKSTSTDCCNCCKQRSCSEEPSLQDFVIKKENVELDDEEIEIIEPDNSENIVYEIYEDSDQNDKLSSDWDDNNPTDKKIINLNSVSDNIEEEEEDEEFTCNHCKVTKPHNWCFLCNRNDICETCEGEGGDYGENEDWICRLCLDKQADLDDDDNNDDEIDKCEICENTIDINSDDVIELIRETDQVKESFIVCIDCFEEKIDDLRKEFWNVDDYLEEEEEEEKRLYTLLDVDGNEIIEEKVKEEEEEEEEEFKCETCSTVQGLNNCEMCDKENVCEECYGQGGDYGPNEIWVCNDCLPTCLKCKSKLSTTYDKCCGKGRSDEDEDDDDDDEDEDDDDEEEEEEEEEVFEIEINGTLYYTTNEKSGDIYEVLEDEDVGDKVGKFINKVARFH